LSHCWGEPENMAKTLLSNLEAYKSEIAWEKLTKTFQHAVHFTYRFGIRYLWIDSLCIVRDDIDDWRAESAKMARVFESAFLTIMATGSRDGSAGLYADCPQAPNFQSLYHTSPIREIRTD
ncbi:heterokaryon incompatibility, partial [Lasiosphaeris hirsuta]